MSQVNEADLVLGRGLEPLDLKEDAKSVLVGVVSAVAVELAMMSIRYLKEKMDERKAKQNVVSE